MLITFASQRRIDAKALPRDDLSYAWPVSIDLFIRAICPKMKAISFRSFEERVVARIRRYPRDWSHVLKSLDPMRLIENMK